MRVLLIDPPHEIFKFFRGRMPAPSLTALSAYIDKDFEVRVIDCTVQERPWAALEAAVREFRPAVVGITAISTSYIYDAMNAAYLVKRIDPSVITVGGGVHMSLVTEETFEKCPSLDYIVMGEGEVTLMEFLRAVEAGRSDFSDIPGLAYRENGGVHIGEKRELIPDLDALPLPGYRHFPMERYMMPSLGMATHNSIVLTTARGCEGICNYCSEARLWRNTWRPKSAARVLDEMELLYRDYNKYSFMFGDNSFNWKRERVEDFIRELEKRRLPVHFWFQSRAEHIVRDADLLPRLKKLGLYMVSMGVETPSEEALRNYRKKQTSATSLEAMRLIKKNGLLLITNIMFGDIDDTEKTLQETIDFAKPYSDHFAICLTTPLPGTDYYKRAKEQGRIKVWDYSKYDMLNPVMETRTLSIEKLAEIHPKAIQKFYSRFRVFWDAFFSPNPYLRKNNKFFVKVAWEVITHKPWVQKNYVPFEKYIMDSLFNKKDSLQIDPLWKNEIERWLKYINTKGQLERYMPDLASRNTIKFLAEISAAYCLEEKMGFDIVEWKPLGQESERGGFKEGEFTININGLHVFCEVKSPGWEGELTEEEKKGERKREGKYSNYCEVRSIATWERIRYSVKKCYPKLPTDKPTLLIINDDLFVPILDTPSNQREIALYDQATGYNDERGCFADDTYKNLSGILFLNVKNYVGGNGIEYKYEFRKNPYSVNKLDIELK